MRAVRDEAALTVPTEVHRCARSYDDSSCALRADARVCSWCGVCAGVCGLILRRELVDLLCGWRSVLICSTTGPDVGPCFARLRAAAMRSLVS